MYTEYVFENKKYDIALRNLKATLLDIVTAEEAKLFDLKTKANDTEDVDKQRELEELSVKQNGYLHSLLELVSRMETSLQQIDSCSRELKQIEDQSVAQIIAKVQDGEFVEEKGELSKPAAAIPNPAVEEEFHTPIMENEDFNSMVPNVEYVSEAAPIGEVTNNVETATAAEPAIVEVTPTEEVTASPEPVMQTEEAVMEYHDDLSTVEEQPMEEITPETNAAPVVEEAATTPAVEENKDTKPAEEAKEEDPNAPKKLVIPSIFTAHIQAQQPATTAPEETKVEEEKVEETTSAPITQETTPATTAPTTTASEPVANEDDNPLTKLVIPIIRKPEEAATTPATDAVAETKEDAPIDLNAPNENPVLVPVPAVSTPETSAEITPATSNTIPLIIPGASSGIEEETPIPPAPTVPETTPVDTPIYNDGPVETINFKKRSTDAPKVIMISGKQAVNLKRSLPTQEALLSAKGFFGDRDTATTDTQPDVISEDKQAQIEQMMQQANQLYSAGKVEEAQNVFNQISEINKQLQKKA